MNRNPSSPSGQEPDALQQALERARALRPGEQVVIPVIAEQLQVDTVRREMGAVRVRKVLDEHVEQVELPGWVERASVERVTVERPAERVEAPRQEGDTWVVPVYEERLVVSKQLYLREELRLRTVRQTHIQRESVTLAREAVVVERRGAGDGDWRADAEGADSQAPHGKANG